MVNGWIVLAIAAGIVALAVAAQFFGFVDVREKRRSSGMGGMFASIDEVFAPTRHEAQQELDRQTILPAPAPLPGDGDKGIAVIGRAAGTEAPAADKYRGSVTIDLTK
jgi:hypothetical protein